MLCAIAVITVQHIHCIQSELGGRRMWSDSSSNIHQNIGTASTCNAAKPQKLQLHARYRILKCREMNTRKLRISYYIASQQYTWPLSEFKIS